VCVTIDFEVSQGNELGGALFVLRDVALSSVRLTYLLVPVSFLAQTPGEGSKEMRSGDIKEHVGGFPFNTGTVGYGEQVLRTKRVSCRYFVSSLTFRLSHPRCGLAISYDLLALLLFLFLLFSS